MLFALGKDRAIVEQGTTLRAAMLRDEIVDPVETKFHNKIYSYHSCCSVRRAEFQRACKVCVHASDRLRLRGHMTTFELRGSPTRASARQRISADRRLESLGREDASDTNQTAEIPILTRPHSRLWQSHHRMIRDRDVHSVGLILQRSRDLDRRFPSGSFRLMHATRYSGACERCSVVNMKAMSGASTTRAVFPNHFLKR